MIEFRRDSLNVDWDSDSLFFTYEWEDETSQFDPAARWNYGSEYYSRLYKARVPLAFKDCEELIDKFICMMIDDYPDEKGFWVK